MTYSSPGRGRNIPRSPWQLAFQLSSPELVSSAHSKALYIAPSAAVRIAFASLAVYSPAPPTFCGTLGPLRPLSAAAAVFPSSAASPTQTAASAVRCGARRIPRLPLGEEENRARHRRLVSSLVCLFFF